MGSSPAILSSDGLPLFDLSAAKRKKELASAKHDLEVSKAIARKAAQPNPELDRAIYGRCATTKVTVTFSMLDGSTVEGRILASSRFCVTVEPEGQPSRRFLLYKHGILRVAVPASEHPFSLPPATATEVPDPAHLVYG